MNAHVAGTEWKEKDEKHKQFLVHTCVYMYVWVWACMCVYVQVCTGIKKYDNIS